MSGGITAMQVMAAAAVAGAAVSVKNGMDSRKAASESAKQTAAATAQAQANADKTAAAADEATNKANQKSPDTSAILDAAAQAGKSGVSGTMLTGSTGVDPTALTLGKSTLLGA